MSPRCSKSVKSISVLTRYMNTCKIPITLPSCQPFILALILEYNTINHLNLLSDNFEEDISPRLSINNEEEIRLMDTTSNDDENSRPTDIVE